MQHGCRSKKVEHFLTRLAVACGVSASTQNHALAAILLLYRQVLDIELCCLANVVRARTLAKVPVVMSRQQVQVLLKVRYQHHLA